MPTKGTPVVDPPFHQTVALAFRCKFACQHGTYKKITTGEETLVNQEVGRDECVEWTEEQQTELLAARARKRLFELRTGCQLPAVAMPSISADI
jgi:hypothetical protein